MVDWDALSYKPIDPELGLQEGEGSQPVEMTQQEILMSNEVEDVSEDLQRESTQEARASMGKTTIAFFDIENMSVPV